MWLLYRIKKNPTNVTETYLHLISRLRPGNEYRIFGKAHEGQGALIKLEPMSEDQVSKPTSRYQAVLKQADNGVEVLVGNRSVNKEQTLFDEDVLRLSSGDAQYKIMWMNMVLLKEGPEDDDYINLLIKGAEWGFNVVQKPSRSITHVVVSETAQDNITPSFITCLTKNVPFITMKWIDDVLLTSDDRKFKMNDINASIQPITWNNFGPFYQDVILNGNNHRSTLFKDLEFIFVDQEQYTTFKSMIEGCQGTARYYSMDNDEDPHMYHKSMLVTPPQILQSHAKYHVLVEEFRLKTDSVRVIEEVELGYAILYKSTNYMCNPNATLSSLSLPSASASAASASAQATVPYTGTGSDSDEDVDIKLEPSSQAAADDTSEVAAAPTAPTSASVAPADPSLQFIEATTTTTINNNSSQEDEEMKDYFKNNRPTCSMNAASLPPVEEEQQEQVEQEEEPEEESLSSLMGDVSDLLGGFVEKLERKPPPKMKTAPTTTTTTTTNATSSSTTNFVVSSPPPHAAATASPPPQSPTTAGSPVFNLPPDPIKYTPYTPLTQSRGQQSAQPPSQLLPSPSPLPLPQQQPQQSSTTRIRSPPPPTTANTITNTTRATAPQPKRRRIQPDDEEEESAPSAQNATTSRPTTNQPSSSPSPMEEITHKYIKFVFKPLVTNPRPPVSTSTASSTRSGSTVNYKRFKKVRQFENHNPMDIVYMVSSSQRGNTQHNNNNNRERLSSQSEGVRLQDTAEFDPDLMIRPPRRRR